MARVVVPGEPHHITQRGNNRQDVFFVDDDRMYFLETLREQCRLHRVQILAYCLMTNHVHLVAVPERADSLGKGIGRTDKLYAEYVNRLHGRSGHLWQGRFNSNPMDDRYTLFAMRYVERNPVRAHMVASAVDYPWSSASAHCGGRDDSGLLDTAAWASRYPPDVWSRMLRDADDLEMGSRLRCNALNGRPLGSDLFIAKLEALLGRRLRPRPAGRKKKGAAPGDGE